MENEKENIDIRLISLYLSGEATPEEIEKLKEWRNSSDENLKQFNHFVSIWEELGKTSKEKDIDIEKEWHIHRTQYIKTEKKVGTWVLNPFMKVAASVVIIIGISIASWLYFSENTIKTDFAENQEVILPDKSIVTLNANSKLAFSNDYGKKNRVVHLAGEAFFKVTKNAVLPFIISTGNAEIKVLGTSFNVKSYSESENIEVIVAEGHVSIHAKDRAEKTVVISSGQKAVFNKQSGMINAELNENVNYIAWKTKSMVFENDSLPYVLRTIEEVYHVEIILTTKELNQCTITTSFDNRDLGTVLKILKSTLNIVIELREDKIYVSGKGC